MVILVRCNDGMYSLALKSRLKELIKEGLVSEFLQEGAWIAAEPVPMKSDLPTPKFFNRRVAAVVSSF